MTADPRVVLLGVPDARNSSFRHGTRLGPPAIRDALASPASNSWSELGVDTAPATLDGGDVQWPDGGPYDGPITDAVGSVLDAGHVPILLGGDHSLTFPVLRAYGERGIRPTIVHVDAHPDTYDDFDGNPWSHASPFARIGEAGLAKRHIQLGIRAMTGHQREQAARFGIEVYGPTRLPSMAELRLHGPVYLTIDLDGLDPAFAPGVAHHEPGGLTTRDLLDVIHGIDVPIVGADVVELDPARDINGVTAMVAAKVVREIVGVIVATAARSS